MKNDKEHQLHDREITLEDRDAEAASPFEDSVAGEEDPGSALEELVEWDKNATKKNQQN